MRPTLSMIKSREHEIVKDLVTHPMAVPWDIGIILCGN